MTDYQEYREIAEMLYGSALEGRGVKGRDFDAVLHLVGATALELMRVREDLFELREELYEVR